MHCNRQKFRQTLFLEVFILYEHFTTYLCDLRMNLLIHYTGAFAKNNTDTVAGKELFEKSNIVAFSEFTLFCNFIIIIIILK